MNEAVQDLLRELRRLRPALTADAARAFAASRFLGDAVALDGAQWPQWIGAGFLDTARTSGETARLAQQACADAAGEAALMRALRLLRRREMARIALRDLAGLAPLDETLGDLSDLADACCAEALRGAEKNLQARWGAPRGEDGAEARPIVLGMGKLGGRELNFSSDIDLIYGYTAGGETRFEPLADGERGAGPRSVSNEEYFNRLAQDVSRILSARTEDGFVFRVDTLLRPFGSAGAPAWSVAAMEDYYQVHGREWERYAWIKARPVAGDLDAGNALLKTLRPFVYRRYLDYNAVVSLRELKRMIEDDVRRKGMDDNVKLGDGGIREIEFIVQSFQLVRGGQEAPLRDHRLRPVLRYLAQAGHLSAETAAALDDAYVFLRRTENAMQMYSDEQTHALPKADDARVALCAALRFENWNALRARLDEVRTFVRREFERVFGEPEQPQAASGAAREPVESALAVLWDGPNGNGDSAQTFAAAGFGSDAPALTDALRDLRDSRMVRAMQESSAQRLRALLPALLSQCLQQPAPGQAALRALNVVSAIVGRANYLTLLRESTTARAHLVELCAASPWVADLLAQSPVLLDSLLDPRSLYAPPEREELAAELAALCATIGPQDTEIGMDLLRRYQKEITLRVAAADVVQALPLVKVSDRLTWLAEAIVRQALDFAWAEMRAQYGRPLRADGTPAAFAVIAYGKFGGIEMSYGSDLDLVFVHDCDQLEADSVDGPRAVNNSVYFGRLAQRLINWLATQTPAGRAYEVDMELRPSGNSGLLVTSFRSLADYQRGKAWTWEHQALTRARPVAGDAALGADFQILRAEMLRRPRDPQTLAREIIEMRARMRQHLEKKVPGKWDVKQGEGGMIEVEFITQFLVLRDAHKDAAVVEWSDNWRQLDALERISSVTVAQKAALIETYRSYRAWTHRRGLQLQDALAQDGQFDAERETIQTLWKDLVR